MDPHIYAPTFNTFLPYHVHTMLSECHNYCKQRIKVLDTNLSIKSIINRTMASSNNNQITFLKYICLILIVSNNINVVCSNENGLVKINLNKTSDNDDYLENNIKNIDNKLNIINKFKPINISYYVNSFKNNTIGKEADNYRESHVFNTGNGLWDNLLNQCYKKPSLSCIQKNVYTYLDDTVGFSGNVNFTSGILFKKNKVDYRKYSRIANTHFSEDLDEENRANNEVNSGRNSDDSDADNESESESPLEEVTDALYSKSVDFLMSHDLEVALPETMFDGATLKLSPRALTKTGALVHIDLQPKKQDSAIGEGRIFFKKIAKYFRKKLLMAALAIILVIKLITLKLVFILPLIMGAGAAKKLFLKLVLFVFPALSHIFKLCSWYHQNFHTPKYHHHHHLVSHHHHKAPPHGPHVAYSAHSPPHTAHIYTKGPPSHDYGPDWELSGPGLGSEYLASAINRNAIANFKPQPVEDLNDINAWGLGLDPGQSGSIDQASVGSTISNAGVGQPVPASYMPNYTARPVGPPVHAPANANRLRKPNFINKETALLQAEKEALLRAAQLAQKAPPSPVRDEVIRAAQAQLAEQARIRVEQKLIEQQQQILAAQDPDTIAADRFYGSLVEKVERIILPLGARDPGCRERAICSLYKEPLHHSPYSNLVSNELSRDSNELQHPAGSRIAMRFYRYVQAARDGQDNKDCIRLYAHCNIDFDKK